MGGTFSSSSSSSSSKTKAVKQGPSDQDRAILETLHGFKRAGCAGVLTYFAPQAARLLG